MTKIRVFAAAAIVLSAVAVPPQAGAAAPDRLLDRQLEIIERLMQQSGGHAGALPDDSYPIPASDLDGDGRSDIIIQSGSREDVFDLTAVKGATGVTLWTRSVALGPPGGSRWNFALPQRLGPIGNNGVLVVGIQYDTFDTLLHLVAVGPDGDVLWRREEHGGFSLGAPMLYDVLHANGAADDVLIGWVDTVEELRIERISTAIVSGEDGSIGARASAIALGGGTRALAVGDLTADGLQDYAIVTSSGEPLGLLSTKLQTHGGTDGAPLWETIPPGSYINDGFMGVPDTDGDGRDDVAIARSPTYPPSPNITLLDGADGHARWNRPANWITGADDTNGDGVAEIMVIEYTMTPSPGLVETRLNFRAINSTGNNVYSTTHTVYTPLSGSSPCVGWSHPGDVNVDHVEDLVYHVWADCRYVSGGEDGVVSGASGAVLWSRSRIGPMLGAAVDGFGNDVALQVARPGATDLTALNGATGATLWTTTVPGPNPWSFQSAFALDVTGDGRAEVFPAIPDLPVVALRATDGTVLWSR